MIRDNSLKKDEMQTADTEENSDSESDEEDSEKATLAQTTKRPFLRQDLNDFAAKRVKMDAKTKLQRRKQSLTTDQEEDAEQDLFDIKKRAALAQKITSQWDEFIAKASHDALPTNKFANKSTKIDGTQRTRRERETKKEPEVNEGEEDLMTKGDGTSSGPQQRNTMFGMRGGLTQRLFDENREGPKQEKKLPSGKVPFGENKTEKDERKNEQFKTTADLFDGTGPK